MGNESRVDCLICSAPLKYLHEPEELSCQLCKETKVANAKCEQGHFVCDSCHNLGANDWIEQICRYVLFTLIVTALLTSIGIYEAFKIPAIKEVQVPIQNLSKEFEGYKILQISDLHIGPTIRKAYVQRVVDTSNSLNPDLIAITGDLVDGGVKELSEHIAPLSKLQSQDGIYFVTGNHEYYSNVYEWEKFLPQLKIQVLRNEGVEIKRGAGALLLAGIDDWQSSPWKGHGPDLKKALALKEKGVPTILLAHQPRGFKWAVDQYGIDLQLSGHTHGGQIWPFNLLVTLVQPYLAELHIYKGKHIYVSRGTGFWGPAIRLRAPSEITLIQLVKAHSPE